MGGAEIKKLAGFVIAEVKIKLACRTKPNKSFLAFMQLGTYLPDNSTGAKEHH